MEELPTKNPDTGYLTNVRCIPIIQNLVKYFTWLITSFYIIQWTVRIATNIRYIGDSGLCVFKRNLSMVYSKNKSTDFFFRISENYKNWYVQVILRIENIRR
jgi:hypothetical protein